MHRRQAALSPASVRLLQRHVQERGSPRDGFTRTKRQRLRGPVGEYLGHHVVVLLLSLQCYYYQARAAAAAAATWRSHRPPLFRFRSRW